MRIVYFCDSRWSVAGLASPLFILAHRVHAISTSFHGIGWAGTEEYSVLSKAVALARMGRAVPRAARCLSRVTPRPRRTTWRCWTVPFSTTSCPCASGQGWWQPPPSAGSRPTAVGLYSSYLAALAHAAVTDGVVVAGERDDLNAVAQLFDLDPAEVEAALTGSDGVCCGEGTRFRLAPRDMVVFTGEMSVPRPVGESRAEAAGLAPRSAVTKKVKLVVAADPDSLSGKAADYDVPIVTEEALPRYCSERDTPERDCFRTNSSSAVVTRCGSTLLRERYGAGAKEARTAS